MLAPFKKKKKHRLKKKASPDPAPNDTFAHLLRQEICFSDPDLPSSPNSSTGNGVIKVGAITSQRPKISRDDKTFSRVEPYYQYIKDHMPKLMKPRAPSPELPAKKIIKAASRTPKVLDKSPYAKKLPMSKSASKPQLKKKQKGTLSKPNLNYFRSSSYAQILQKNMAARLKVLEAQTGSPQPPAEKEEVISSDDYEEEDSEYGDPPPLQGPFESRGSNRNSFTHRTRRQVTQIRESLRSENEFIQAASAIVESGVSEIRGSPEVRRDLTFPTARNSANPRSILEEIREDLIQRTASFEEGEQVMEFERQAPSFEFNSPRTVLPSRSTPALAQPAPEAEKSSGAKPLTKSGPSLLRMSEIIKQSMTSSLSGDTSKSNGFGIPKLDDLNRMQATRPFQSSSNLAFFGKKSDFSPIAPGPKNSQKQLVGFSPLGYLNKKEPSFQASNPNQKRSSSNLLKARRRSIATIKSQFEEDDESSAFSRIKKQIVASEGAKNEEESMLSESHEFSDSLDSDGAKLLISRNVRRQQTFVPSYKGRNTGSKKRNRKWWIIYPDNRKKLFWDFWVTVVLLFSCLETPFTLVFRNELDFSLIVFEAIVDFVFFLDLLANFFTAFRNEFNGIVDRQASIANRYIQGWFFVDLISIIPMDLLLSQTNIEVLWLTGRFARLFKMNRLLRVFKLLKEKSNLMWFLQENLTIGIGIQRMIVLTMFLTLVNHVIACLWVLFAWMQDDVNKTWLAADVDESSYAIYLDSLYFVFSTMTTVGYGDISAVSLNERKAAVGAMFFSVMSFSFVTGSLSSLLQSLDSLNVAHEVKVQFLNMLSRKYDMPKQLYASVRQSFRNKVDKDLKDMERLLEELPVRLRLEVMYYQHYRLFKSIPFFSEKTKDFLTWVTEFLRQEIHTEEEYIGFEGDAVTGVHFLYQGSCGFVLPKHGNICYIDIDLGCHFGSLDLFCCCLQHEVGLGDDWVALDKKFVRHFTIQVNRESSMFFLSLTALTKMKIEYLSQFEDLFSDADCQLQNALMVKLKALAVCEEQLEKQKGEIQEALYVNRKNKDFYKFYNLQALRYDIECYQLEELGDPFLFDEESSILKETKSISEMSMSINDFATENTRSRMGSFHFKSSKFTPRSPMLPPKKKASSRLPPISQQSVSITEQESTSRKRLRADNSSANSGDDEIKIVSSSIEGSDDTTRQKTPYFNRLQSSQLLKDKLMLRKPDIRVSVHGVEPMDDLGKSNEILPEQDNNLLSLGKPPDSGSSKNSGGRDKGIKRRTHFEIVKKEVVSDLTKSLYKTDKDNLKRIMEHNKKKASNLPALAKSNLKTFKEKDQTVDDVRESEDIVKRIAQNKPRISFANEQQKARVSELSPASVVSFGRNQSPPGVVDESEANRKSLLEITGLFRASKRFSKLLNQTQDLEGKKRSAGKTQEAKSSGAKSSGASISEMSPSSPHASMARPGTQLMPESKPIMTSKTPLLDNFKLIIKTKAQPQPLLLPEPQRTDLNEALKSKIVELEAAHCNQMKAMVRDMKEVFEQKLAQFIEETKSKVNRYFNDRAKQRQAQEELPLQFYWNTEPTYPVVEVTDQQIGASDPDMEEQGLSAAPEQLQPRQLSQIEEEKFDSSRQDFLDSIRSFANETEAELQSL